ncbi:hypothetical protein B0H17DRAFT_1146051 [Mycena rosella]|uniref:Nephrocystin 3-like N-terminal domain-containing protein n=1 Tax=Mycena rosella TaxID=1033263 RepID=A0AAD7CPQ0_MYCRO|nr:hypothetical protein B0H17DRAFT_1146051 [Mycena rosella]
MDPDPLDNYSSMSNLAQLSTLLTCADHELTLGPRDGIKDGMLLQIFWISYAPKSFGNAASSPRKSFLQRPHASLSDTSRSSLIHRRGIWCISREFNPIWRKSPRKLIEIPGRQFGFSIIDYLASPYPLKSPAPHPVKIMPGSIHSNKPGLHDSEQAKFKHSCDARSPPGRCRGPTPRTVPEINFLCSPHVMDTATRAPLLRLTKTRRAANQATPAVPSESQVSLRPEPRGQITGFRERLRSWARDPGTRLPPHTPSPESQPGITGISTNPSGQLDSQQPVPGLSVANREASNKTESVVNIIVDNLAQAAEICEKIANVVDKAPLIGPLAALVSTILKTCKEIKDTYEHRNNLFKRIERIALDLHGTIMRMETTQYTDGSTGRLKSDIEEYVGLFKKASALLSDFDTQGKLKITVNHKDWESKLAALDRELDSFAGQFNTKRGTDIQIGQSAIRKKVDEVQVLALGKKLQEWLQSPPDMGLKHHATQKLHHEGTGTWFLDGPEFTEWRENPGSLWIEGKWTCLIGSSWCRKERAKVISPPWSTKLELTRVVYSSTVIEKLLASSNEAYAVGYFYFDFRKDETQLVETMLRSIILQLSKQSPQPYSTLDQQYENRKGVTPIYDNLRDVLDKLLSELGRTCIVLDALDECKETDRLIDFISPLQNRTTSPLHLLFTSQSRTDFTAAFKGLPHVLLEPETTRNDIIHFVDSELRSPKLKHWEHHITKITAVVVDKSNGMFRLAACLLLELSGRKFDESPDTILAELSSDLFEIYGRFLEGIHTANWLHIGRVLRWILFSGRPLTLIELEESLAFDFHAHEHVFEPTKRRNYANRACELLEGLVAVDMAPSTNNEDPSLVVTLAHASVADYLMSPAFVEQYKLSPPLCRQSSQRNDVPGLPTFIVRGRVLEPPSTSLPRPADTVQLDNPPPGERKPTVCRVE